MLQEDSSERNTFEESGESFHGKQIGGPVYLKKKIKNGIEKEKKKIILKAI